MAKLKPGVLYSIDKQGNKTDAHLHAGLLGDDRAYRNSPARRSAIARVVNRYKVSIKTAKKVVG